MMKFIPNKTRYLKQQDKYSCSAVALLNLDKWRGIKVTKKNLPQYKQLLNTKISGTTSEQFNRVVGRKGKRLTYQQLKNHLGVVILETTSPLRRRHDYLVLGWSRHNNVYGWLAINYSS